MGGMAYTLQDADISPSFLAERFRTTVREIWIATASEAGKYKNVSQEEFFKNLRVGDVLMIPYAELAWESSVEWQTTTPGPVTLAEVCKKTAKLTGVGGPEVTPALLWFHIRNEFFRGAVFKRQPNEDARRALDKDPSQVKLTGEDQLLVPKPKPIVASPISAKRSQSKDASATIESAPEWVSRLRAYASQVGVLSDKLANANKICNKLQEEGMSACYLVSSLHRLLALQLKHASPSNTAKLQELQKKFAELHAEVIGLFFANPAEKLNMPEDAARKRLAEELRDLLRSSDLEKYTTLAAKATKERVGGAPVRAISDGLFARGYAEIARSHYAGDAFKDAEDTLSRLAGRAPSAASTTPISKYVELTAGLNGIACASVGNLPSPASFAVAFVEVDAVRILPDLLRDAWGASNTIDEKALLAPNADEFTRWRIKTQAQFIQRAKDIRSTLAKQYNLTPDEVRELERVIDQGTREERRALASSMAAKLASNTHASASWHGLMTVLGLLSLISAIMSDDKDAVRKALNILGGGIGFGLGALQLIASLSQSEALGKCLASVGPYFGVATQVVGIMTGAITALTAPIEDKVVIVSATGQMVGSFAAVAGFTMAVPGLQLFGAGVLIASTAVGLWPTIKELSGPGTKRVFLAQLESLRALPIFTKMCGVRPYLNGLVDDIVKLVKKDDDGGLFEMNRTDGVLSFLKRSGFCDQDIDWIAPPPTPYVKAMP